MASQVLFLDHAARTGQFIDGNPLHQQPERVIRWLLVVKHWMAAADRRRDVFTAMEALFGSNKKGGKPTKARSQTIALPDAVLAQMKARGEKIPDWAQTKDQYLHG